MQAPDASRAHLLPWTMAAILAAALLAAIPAAAGPEDEVNKVVDEAFDIVGPLCAPGAPLPEDPDPGAEIEEIANSVQDSLGSADAYVAAAVSVVVSDTSGGSGDGAPPRVAAGAYARASMSNSASPSGFQAHAESEAGAWVEVANKRVDAKAEAGAGASADAPDYDGPDFEEQEAICVYGRPPGPPGTEDRFYFMGSAVGDGGGEPHRFDLHGVYEEFVSPDECWKEEDVEPQPHGPDDDGNGTTQERCETHPPPPEAFELEEVLIVDSDLWECPAHARVSTAAYLYCPGVPDRRPPPPPRTDDHDGDGNAGASDNCPGVPNRDQRDRDGDGIGDACDHPEERSAPAPEPTPQRTPDRDRDGVPDERDVCPADPDPGQGDLDADGQGDACDPDADGDGVPEQRRGETLDNCPRMANPYQADTDGDGIGDLCDQSQARPTFEAAAGAPGRHGEFLEPGHEAEAGFQAADPGVALVAFGVVGGLLVVCVVALARRP